MGAGSSMAMNRRKEITESNDFLVMEMLEAERRSSTIFSEVMPGNPDMLLHTWVGFNQ